MNILPAIDLMGGKAVRLLKGRKQDATVYHDNPAELAKLFADEGAQLIHVVDLDGAFEGERQQFAMIDTIASASPIPLQVGGGLRTAQEAEQLIDAGVARVVFGTAAIENPELVDALCERHPNHIVVAVDAREGMVATKGWTEATQVSAAELAAQVESWGGVAVIYTDIGRDGTEGGPNVAATVALQESLTRMPVIASGGIGTIAHVESLAAAGIDSAIIGRALYEKNFSLAEAIAKAKAAAPADSSPSQ